MTEVKKTNPWLSHVAKYRADHPELAYKDVLAQAKSSYVPVKKEGGALRVAGSGLRVAGGGAKKEKKPKKEKKEKVGQTGQKAGALRLAGQKAGSGCEGSGVADVAYKKAMKKMKVQGVDNLYAGEKHSPLQMPDGSLQVGNWIGPGTHAETRAARGDKGLTMIDELSRRHDAFYSLAKTKKDIRRADEDFLRILKSGVIKDTEFNKKAGNLGISAKYATETITGVKFPTSKELKANDPTNPLLLKIIEDTNAMFGVAPKSGKGLRLAGQSGKGLRLAGQSGEGILDQLQKMVDWIFGKSKKGKPEEAKQPEPAKETCKQILEKYGIVDKKSFRKWALQHHPDKQAKDPETQAAANELFAQIKNCMETEQIGQGIWDVVKGIFKDPAGALVQIFDHFSKSKTWSDMEEFLKTDSLSQEVINKMDSAMKEITSVVKDIPVVGEVAELPFAGWDAYSKEFKQKDKSKIKPKTLDFLKSLGQWKIYQKLHPDIGDDWMEYTQKEYGRLGATRYKAEIPRIVKDMLRRTKLYLKYLTADIKKRIDLLNAESIRIVKEGGTRGRAIVDAVKYNPAAVSKEFKILLGKEWDTKNPLLKEMFDDVFPKTDAYSRPH